MAEQPPSDKQKSASATGGQIINVEFGTANSTAVKIVHVKPGDTVNFKGIDLAQAKIDIIGSDIVITNEATGEKILLPEAGLFLFSKDQAPLFSFNGNDIDSNDLLSRVGMVKNITEKDYVSFTSLPLQNDQAKADAAEGKEQKDGTADAQGKAEEAVMVMPSAPPPVEEDMYSDPPGNNVDPLLVSSSSLLADSAGKKATASAIPTPPPSSSSSNSNVGM